MNDYTLTCICGRTAGGHAGADHPFLEKRPDYDPSTWLRGARFEDEDLNPATPLYITVEDRLRVAILCLTTAVEVDVTARLQLPDGQVIPVRLPILPANSTVIQNFDFDLAEGFLLDLAVLTPTAGVRVGQVFVVAQIIRSAGANALPSRTLTSNYVSSGNVLGWPEGPNQQSVQGAGVPITIQQANPIAGADFTFTVPTATRLLLQSFSALFTTSVAAANRQPHVQIRDAAGNIVWDAAASAVQVASLAVRYSACGGIQATVTDSSALIPVPDVSLMLQGWTVRTVTTAIQGADQWSAIWFSCLQWLEL